MNATRRESAALCWSRLRGWLWLLLVLPGAAAAQWDIVEEPVPGGGGAPVRVAKVENDSGHVLRIYLDEGAVVGVFALREGFDRLAAESCPTYRVDDREPVPLASLDGGCRIDGKSARFVLGREHEGTIRSEPLHRLMNGTAIVFRYRMAALGYRQTEFSLNRSKYAVRGAVGRDIDIVKE